MRYRERNGNNGYVQKRRPQSRTTVMACSFCITVESSTVMDTEAAPPVTYHCHGVLVLHHCGILYSNGYRSCAPSHVPLSWRARFVSLWTPLQHAMLCSTRRPSGVIVRNFNPHTPKSADRRQRANAGYGSGAWRDRDDRPSRVHAGQQGDERRVERAVRPPRTPGAVRPARQNGRNKE